MLKITAILMAIGLATNQGVADLEGEKLILQSYEKYILSDYKLDYEECDEILSMVTRDDIVNACEVLEFPEGLLGDYEYFGWYAYALLNYNAGSYTYFDTFNDMMDE